jgi:hypothetical protein
MDNIKKKVGTSEIPKEFPKGHIMLNNDKESKIPDITKLTGQIIEFIEYIEQPEMKKFAKENNMMFKQHVENKFEDFTLDYYSIYKMLADNEEKRADNIDKLFNMLSRLKDVETGKSNVEKEFMKVREELAHEFLYPQFGGKKGFEKAMEEDLKKNKKSK